MDEIQKIMNLKNGVKNFLNYQTKHLLMTQSPNLSQKLTEIMGMQNSKKKKKSRNTDNSI